MHNKILRELDWQPVMLVYISQRLLPLPSHVLYTDRVYLALHPDGVVCAAWDVLPEERDFPRVHLVGWKPLRDVPFDLPVRFERKGDPHVSSSIPNGTWVLPYDPNTYSQLEQAQTALQQAINHVCAILSNVVR